VSDTGSPEPLVIVTFPSFLSITVKYVSFENPECCKGNHRSGHLFLLFYKNLTFIPNKYLLYPYTEAGEYHSLGLFYTEPKEYPSVPPLYTDPGGTTVLVYTTGSFSFLMLRF
jgi:hypothetical protein